MDARDYLEHAIAAADAGGGFDSEALCNRLGTSPPERRAVVVALAGRGLLADKGRRWTLLGVARELAARREHAATGRPHQPGAI
jgi:hypothetical protein